MNVSTSWPKVSKSKSDAKSQPPFNVNVNFMVNFIVNFNVVLLAKHTGLPLPTQRPWLDRAWSIAWLKYLHLMWTRSLSHGRYHTYRINQIHNEWRGSGPLEKRRDEGGDSSVDFSFLNHSTQPFSIFAGQTRHVSATKSIHFVWSEMIAYVSLNFYRMHDEEHDEEHGQMTCACLSG